ncbi:MAG: allantoinase AllB [bacterium]
MSVVANAEISTGEGNETRRVHIVIDGEAIREILPGESRLPRGEQVIDADGLLVIPGAIDPHVHFDTPGYTEHEDFTCGSMSSAAGGVTCVIDMPDTSIPPVTERAGLMAKLRVINDMSVIDFALWGGISGNAFRTNSWRSHIRSLKHEGVVGIKCYLLSGMPTFEHLLPLELVEVMRRAAELNMVLGLHAEDRDIVQRRTASLQVAGRRDAKAYYEARSDPAELEGARTGIAIAQETGCSLHIVHVGSAAAAAAAIEARKKGADITLETCPHYLAFSHDELEERGAILKTAPVVKTKDDSQKLWEALANGGIDFIASDHAPCTPKEKESGSIWTDYSGISGTELVLHYPLSDGYCAGRLTLARLVEVTSSASAKRYGLYPRKGAIVAGTDADLAFIDPSKKWTVRGENFASKGKFTPFEGREFTGRVVRTMCRGSFVYEEGKGVTVPPGYGNFVRRIG